MTKLKIINDSDTLKKNIQEYKIKKKKIGYVATLGSLHKGHLNLIRLAKKKTQIVVVSIFLNPLQFNSKKDFLNYPKSLKKDKKKIYKENIDILYTPSIKEIFFNKKIEKIKASKKANKLCGVNRKGHFNGVVSILKPLFTQIQPSIAFFGEKDFQQIMVVKDLIKKYKMNIKIVILKTIRNSHGLAYSSRNKILNIKEKKIAKYLFITIKEIFFLALKNFKKIKEFEKLGKIKLLKYGFTKVDYFKIYNENNLSKQKINKNNFRVFAAACLGKTRLIDNYKKI